MKEIIFNYDGHTVTFEKNGNVMVNATEMANIFDKKVSHFLENKQTQDFIEVCLNSRNSDYLK